MNHNNNFNFLRLTAAILVVISHSYMVTGNYSVEPLRIFTNNGIIFSTIGLYIFFFTSGFLVTKSALQSDNSIHFLFKRFLRIYPLLILVVLVSVFIAGPVLTRYSAAGFFRDPDSWKYLWTMSGLRVRIFLPGVFDSVGFHNNLFNIPLWSIELEILLYFSVAVFLAFKLVHKKQAYLGITVSIILALSAMVLFENHLVSNGIKINQKQLKLIIAFFLGSLLQSRKSTDKKLIAVLVFSFVSFFLRVSNIWRHAFILDEVLLFCVLTYLVAFTQRLRIVIKNDLSYGIYVFTYPLQQYYFYLLNYNGNPILNIIVSLGTSCMLAYLSWTYIEKPSLSLKSYYYRFSTLFATE